MEQKKNKAEELDKEDLQGFQVLKLHYSADPDKDEAWAAKAKQEYPSELWSREFELQPVGHAGNYPVFGDYKKILHESSKLVYYPGIKQLVRGWDFGKVHPCVEFIQVDGMRKNVVGEVYGNNIYLPQFVEEVLAYGQINFPGAQFLDWVDATGKNERDNGLPSIQILRQFSLKPRWRMQDIEEGIKYIQHDLITFSQGRPQFMLNPQKCPHLAAAMRTGYCRNKTAVPIKDGTHDHPVDALRYGYSGIVTNTSRGDKDYREKLKNYKYKASNPITGR